MKSVDNVPRSLACIFDGHKTEEAAELAANNLASVLQSHMLGALIFAGTSLLHLTGVVAHDAGLCLGS